MPATYPVPTPYQPPQYGGNKSVPVGTIGPSIPASSKPIASTSSGGILFNTGQVTPVVGATKMNNIASSPWSNTNNNQVTTASPQSTQTAPPSGGGQQKMINLGGYSVPEGINPETYYINGRKLGDILREQQSQPQGPSQEDIMREIDGQYNSQYGYLDQTENALRQDYPNVLKEAEAMYGAAKGQLDTKKQSSLSQIDLNRGQAQNRKEDALASARRMYQELQMGNTQRFGGASSAGQAASELQGREMQSQFGQTNRQFNDISAQLQAQAQDIESNYNTGLQQLEAQKIQTINQTQRDFQNKLLEIANNRTLVGNAKAQARLSALMDLRNQVFAVQQQTTQFAQSLEAQRQQALMQIEVYNQTTGRAVAAGQSAFAKLTGGTTLTPGSKFTIGNRQAISQEPQYIGAIGKSIVGRDELGRTIYDDGTAGYTQYDSFGNRA